MKIAKLMIAAALSSACLGVSAPAGAQSDPFLGETTAFAMNWCPRGWAAANGATLAITSNTALFSLLGTTFGGNGTTNFVLPDLRGRTPVTYGQGLGLSNYFIGEPAGTESITLTTAQLPTHSHQAFTQAYSGAPNSDVPTGRTLADFPTGVNPYVGTPNTAMAANTAQTNATGGGQPFDNRQPYLALNWCIALTGTYPPRS